MIEILSRDDVKEGVEGGLNDFKFVTFVGHFWSDGAASMAVKGLRHTTHLFHIWLGRTKVNGT